jgi:hypothetical protein
MYQSLYQKQLFRTYWYIPVRTDIGNLLNSTYQYVLICTALYLRGTRRYKVIEDGTRRYQKVQERYMEVQGSAITVVSSTDKFILERSGLILNSTDWYILVRTELY